MMQKHRKNWNFWRRDNRRKQRGQENEQEADKKKVSAKWIADRKRSAQNGLQTGKRSA
jgi:hypothetical protein